MNTINHYFDGSTRIHGRCVGWHRLCVQRWTIRNSSEGVWETILEQILRQNSTQIFLLPFMPKSFTKGWEFNGILNDTWATIVEGNCRTVCIVQELITQKLNMKSQNYFSSLQKLTYVDQNKRDSTRDKRWTYITWQ